MMQEYLLVLAGLVLLVAVVAVMTVFTSKSRDQFIRVDFDAEKARELSERYMGKSR